MRERKQVDFIKPNRAAVQQTDGLFSFKTYPMDSQIPRETPYSPVGR
jgi:hypothetical protein